MAAEGQLVIPKWFLVVVSIVGPLIGTWVGVEIRRAQGISELNTAELVKLNEKQSELNLKVATLNVHFEQFAMTSKRLDFLDAEVRRGDLDRAELHKQIELLRQRMGMP